MKKHIAQFLVLAVALILLGCAHATPGTPTEQEPVAAVTEATTETTAPRETKAPTEPAETAAPREPEETEAPTEAPTEHKHSFRKKVTKEPMFTLPKTGNSGT